MLGLSDLKISLLSTGSFLGGAALNLNFLGGVLDSRVTFTRGTTATFVGSNGLIQSSAINEPRFDYDPVTLAAKGLLIEEQRTNLVLRSEDFDNAGWTKTNATISANAIAAPNGTVTADKITPTAVSGEHFVRQIITVSAGSTVTASVFVKAGGYPSIRLRCLDNAITTNGFIGSLDTSTGFTFGQVVGLGTFLGVSATYFGNDWWRISLVGSAGATATSIIFDAFVLSGNEFSSSIFIGNGTSGLFLWGAQMEVGAFVTSYIPTVASQVTRSADVATMTGGNFSSWYNQTQGTMIASWSTTSVVTSVTLGVFSVTDGSPAERIQIRRVATSNAVGFIVVDGGVTQYIDQIAASSNINISAFAYRVNDFIGANNGTLGIADTSGTLATVTQAEIGFGQGLTYLNGHLRSISYYSTRLPNATLVSLTA